MYQETPAQKKPPRKEKTEATEVKTAPADISYTVGMSKPWTHLLEVEMRLNWTQMPEKAELKMPVWTPGSYLVREYARHVQDFVVKDAAGKDLPWEKINKNTWSVTTGGAKEIVATYRVYANELTVRTNELNDEHGFWNNAATLMFVKGQLKTPATVTVKPFGSWKIATGLPAVSGKTSTFHAENYDILYDSPFEVSDFKEVGFDVEGKHHRIIFSGEGNYDMQKSAVDVAKIVEEAYKIFGELPYNDYTFIVNLRGGGGLEHLNSTALQVGRFNFQPESRYKNFLGLVAHEYFHAFNVKRIRPDALGPFDYENENYTKMLWLAEGGTEYYSNLILRRAGIISDADYLKERADGIQQLQERPGRFETSVEDASFDAWIKYYRPDENAVNNQISYYDKGEIVAMMLDVTIRSSSGGTKSLDDVMRYLYTDFYKKGRNYTPEDFQKIAEQMAGVSLDDFFKRYVRGTDEIDCAKILSALGLNVVTRDSTSGKAYLGSDALDGSITIRSVPALGVDLSEEQGKLSVKMVLAGSPGYEQGLNAGDQVIAVDGYKANQSFVQRYFNERKAGENVKLTVFRFDKLKELNITIGSNARKQYVFEKVAAPTDLQKKLYHDYLNADL
jgi:predicted metalloprotease with PDZ domain